MRYILIKNNQDGREDGTWINSSQIITIEDHDDYAAIKLVGGTTVYALYQDAIDILSMLNLDTHPSCGSQIADSPGIPVRTGMELATSHARSRILQGRSNPQWVEVEL